MATIVLGITGSIAAYKSADIASALVKDGHEVHCVMTQSATEFIPPFTLQILSRNPVLVSLQDEKQRRIVSELQQAVARLTAQIAAVKVKTERADGTQMPPPPLPLPPPPPPQPDIV